jgi:hypothetical protein
MNLEQPTMNHMLFVRFYHLDPFGQELYTLKRWLIIVYAQEVAKVNASLKGTLRIYSAKGALIK